MITTKQKNSLQFQSETYCLTFLKDRPFVNVHSPHGDLLAELFILSSIHSLHGRDDTIWIGKWEVDERPGETIVLLRAESSLWMSTEMRKEEDYQSFLLFCRQTDKHDYS